MITIFTRKELLVTTNMGQQAEVRNILSANKIAYTVKVTNLQSSSFFGSDRARFGSLGISVKHSYEYKIYVHKKDYTFALHLLR